MGGRLQGKHIIIAGAGQTPGPDLGNGRAMALLFAREGAHLFLTARHLERAEETARMIRAENPEAVVYTHAMDATDEKQVSQALALAAQKLGSLDVLVDNIGIMLPQDESLLTVDDATYDRMVATNEKSALYLLRGVQPYMQERGGAVVLVSSIAGVSVGKNSNMYNLTKAGMSHLGQLFAAMYAPQGIRVNTIVLGMVQTAMAVTFNQEKQQASREEIIRRRNTAIPLKGGAGSAWDTAYAALFLASDESRFITGAALPVDGGMALRRG